MKPTAFNRQAQPCAKRYRDEDWIDMLLNKKSMADYNEMVQHLVHTSCRSCTQTKTQWSSLLQESEQLDTAATAPIYPAMATQQRLVQHVRRRKMWTATKASFLQARLPIITAAILVLIVGLIGLFRDAFEPMKAQNQYVAQHEPRAISFMNDPATSSFQIETATNHPGDGFAWYNKDTQEVFVLLEGLLPSNTHVLQAWAVGGEGHANLGLLQYDHTKRAHIYFKGAALTTADNITLTIEPYGGSVAPSAPEVYWFRLGR